MRHKLLAKQNISSRYLAALLIVVFSPRYKNILCIFVLSWRNRKHASFYLIVFNLLFASPNNDDNLSLAVVSRRREKMEICVFPLFWGEKDEQTKMIVISRQNTLNSKMKYSAKKGRKYEDYRMRFCDKITKTPKWLESATTSAKGQLR